MTDRTIGDTFYIMFTTRALTGIPTVLSGTPVVSAYEDGSTTQITAGITLGVDHDSVVGLNLLTIVATTGNGFEAGKDYNLVVTTGTVDSVSAVGEVVGTFTIELASASPVWDRILSGATHNINNSAGKRLRQLGGLIFTDGMAQGGAANSIQLASGAVTTNDQYRRAKALIVGGTGAGQEAIVTSSVASTDTLTTTPAWLTNPDATSEYEIVPGQAHSTVRNGGYDNGMVYIDTVGGTTGTEKGVNGTSTNPSSSVADAYVIAANENLTTFEITPGSAITLPSDSSGKIFMGSAYTLALNGQEIGASRFESSLSVTGVGIDTGGGLPPVFERCSFGACTLPPCVGAEVGFTSTITLGAAGNYAFGNSATIFGGTVIFDYGAGLNASKVFLTSWLAGSVEIQNAGAGTGAYEFSMSGVGDLTVNANCSATTTVKLGGSVSRNADVAGITYTELENVTSDVILDTALTESYAANGVAPTLTQAMMAVHQMLMEFAIAGTAYTVKQLDSSTTAFVVTLDDAANPTGVTR